MLNSIMDSYNRSAYSKSLNMKTRIDTSFKDDTRNKYALFCVQPAFDIISSELNKMESIKHNVEKADDNIHGVKLYQTLSVQPRLYLTLFVKIFENNTGMARKKMGKARK